MHNYQDHKQSAEKDKSRLSPREKEVIQHCRKGLDRQQIATAMDVELNTVHTFFKNIHLKLGINTHGQLMSLIIQEAAVLC